MQHQSHGVRPPPSGFLWTPLNAAGTRPETAFPAIPPPAKPAKHARTPVKVACPESACTAPSDQRRIQPFSEDIRMVRPAALSAPTAINLNETRGVLRVRVSIPPSACIPPLAICFPRRAPRQGGMSKTEQAMTQQEPAAEHEPLNLLADWISRDQLAQELGLTSDTLYRWEARRLGPPCTRIGRKTLYRRASVQDWIRAQEQVHPVHKTRGRS